ncbi:MAG: hypothetical protein M1405_01745 [Patescibacteria group bacterium]|nr:hypothetical protein [Patescibacteria group bacterium]
MSVLKRFLPLILLIALSFWAIKPLLSPGFFPIHDDEQIARLYELTMAVNNGQIPPRWVADLGFGYGFPLFNFYPPLIYYLGYLFHLVGFSLIDSTKIVIGLGFILSAYFMFIWVKKHYGVSGGLAAATLYTYVPYHAVDLYVRGALSEFFSFVWIPAVFWAFDRCSEKKTVLSAVIAGVLLSFVVLTHNLVTIQFISFLAVYLLYLFYKERKSIKKVFLLFSLSGLTSLGMSAYFWLPAILEKKYTLVDKILLGELASYKLHFVCPWQFINSPWGYGGSIAGCVDGLSFQIGKVQIAVSILAIILIVFSVLFKRKLSFSIKLPFVVFFLFIFSLFMATSYSQLVWSIFQPLAYIQFPWRFLLFTAVFTSFLGGFVAAVLKRHLNKYLFLVVCTIFAVGLLYSVRFDFKPSSYLFVNDSYYISKQDLQWRVSRMSYEYVPKGVATKLSNIDTTVLDISEKDIPKKSYEVLKGEMNVNEVLNVPQYKKYIITVNKPGSIRINTYSFPGWVLIVDGVKVGYNDMNKLKLITFNLPVGNHNVEVLFENTLIRNAGNTITVLTLLFVLFIVLYYKVYKSKYLTNIKEKHEK